MPQSILIDGLKASLTRSTTLSQSTFAWVASLALLALVLQAMLAWHSPHPDGYVHDFYSDAVKFYFRTSAIPTAGDCFTCYHPPMLPVLGGIVFDIAEFFGASRNTRYATLATVLGFISLCFVYFSCRIYLQYREDNGRYFDLLAFALICFLPVRVISSHAIESEILVATMIVIALFYFGEFMRRRIFYHLLIAGAFAGFAALTKYTGALVALVLVGILFIDWIIRKREHGLREFVCFSAIVFFVGVGPYAHNVVKHDTPFPGNYSWTDENHASKYSFSKFSINRIVDSFNRKDGRKLGDFDSYSNEYVTSLYGQLWTDYSFFTVPTRHGQAYRMNLHNKEIPIPLIEAILIAGIPTILFGLIGGAILLFRPGAYVLLAVAAASVAVYISWTFKAPTWMLKTKYLLFLTPLLPIALSMFFKRGYVLFAKMAVIAPSVVLSFVYSFYFATV